MASERNKDAAAHLRKAIEAEDNDPDLWYLLSIVEYDDRRYDASVDAFTELAERWPDVLPHIDSSFVYDLLRKLEPGSQRRLDYLQTLFDAKWDHPDGDASDLWHLLARMRLDRGDTAGARAVVRRVVHPMSIVRMRADKRFDALVDRDAWAFNVAYSAERAVDVQRAKVDAHPRKLAPGVELTYTLLQAGRHEEVLAFVDRIDAAIKASPEGEPPFEDMDEVRWLVNYRAIALYRLGRREEALEDLRRASRMSEEGGDNVNQTLNLADFLCALGRADDAVRTVSSVKASALSGYGRAFQASVQLCAAAQLQDARAMRRAYDLLRKLQDEGRSLQVKGALLAGRLDDAAREVIARLDSPEDRDRQLYELQSFRQVASTSAVISLRQRYAELVARPDVQAAIARVGRIERHDLFSDGGFD